MIKYKIPEILKKHENIIKRTYRYCNEISFKRKMYFRTREMPMSSSLDLFNTTFENKISEKEYDWQCC